MTTAFGGLTTGSRTHRSSYENGDERPCLFVRPSVILPELEVILSMKNVKMRIFLVVHVTLFDEPYVISRLSAVKEKNQRERVASSIVWFDDTRQYEEQVKIRYVERLLGALFPSGCFVFH